MSDIQETLDKHHGYIWDDNIAETLEMVLDGYYSSAMNTDQGHVGNVKSAKEDISLILDWFFLKTGNRIDFDFWTFT